MIKRLKWNVLHGSDNDGSGGDLVSSGSEEDFEQVSRHLAQLAKNDPDLQTLREESSGQENDGDDFLRDEYSENEDNGKVAGFDELAMVVANQKSQKKRRSPRGENGVEDDSFDADCESESGEDELLEEEEGEKFVEWRECNLCPGKRFLNDGEVESHLLSKGHNRALKKYERQKQREAEQEEGADAGIQQDREVEEHLGGGDEVAQSEKGTQGKRKNVTKTKLRAEYRKNRKIASGGEGEGNTTQRDRVSRAPDTQGAKTMEDAKGDSSSSDAARRKKLAAKKKLKRMKERKWKRQQELMKNQSSPAEKAAKQKTEKAKTRNAKQKEVNGEAKDETEAELKAERISKTKDKAKPRSEAKMGTETKVKGVKVPKLTAVNGKVADAARRAALDSAEPPHRPATIPPQKKGPKVKSKKPMSAEKAARKALKRELEGKSNDVSFTSRKRPCFGPASTPRKKIKKGTDTLKGRATARSDVR